MLRALCLSLALFLTAACSDAAKIAELAATDRIVAAPRDQVYAELFDPARFEGEIPMVSNGSDGRIYELVVTPDHPQWDVFKPKGMDSAHTVKMLITLDQPHSASMMRSVNDGELVQGWTFNFEEVEAGKTRVSVDVENSNAAGSEARIEDSIQMQAVAIQALAKLSKFEEVPAGPNG